MNKKQALALLQLMADCYSVINAPVPEPAVSQPEPAPSGNGKGRVRETQPVSTD